MADKAAADLAADVAAHAGLMAELRRRQQEGNAAAQPHSISHADNKNNQQRGSTANDAAAINAVGPEGLSPLAVACMHGKVEDVALLLTFGADPAAESDLWDLPNDFGGEIKKMEVISIIYCSTTERQ